MSAPRIIEPGMIDNARAFLVGIVRSATADQDSGLHLCASNALSALDALVAHVSVSPPWQQIGDAPKDGTPLILARFGWANDTGEAVPGSDEWRRRIWDNSRRTYSLWWVCKGHWSGKWNNWNDGLEPSGLNDPTHFQPLPAPPVPV